MRLPDLRISASKTELILFLINKHLALGICCNEKQNNQWWWQDKDKIGYFCYCSSTLYFLARTMGRGKVPRLNRRSKATVQLTWSLKKKIQCAWTHKKRSERSTMTYFMTEERPCEDTRECLWTSPKPPYFRHCEVRTCCSSYSTYSTKG